MSEFLQVWSIFTTWHKFFRGGFPYQLEYSQTDLRTNVCKFGVVLYDPVKITAG